MILVEDFKLDYVEIVKALSGEHQAPAGAVAHAPSASATPQSEHKAKPTGAAAQPRQGHRYVKRWWDAGKWQYEYPGEGIHQHQGQAHFGEHEKREHVLELPEVHNYGPGQEEQAYKESLGTAFAPGSKHQVPNPDPKSDGQPLNVTVKKNGDILVDGIDRPFKSHGAYERWYRSLQMGPEEYADPSGKPLLQVVPNVGKPVEGVLHPSSDERQWIIKIADNADPGLAQAVQLGKRPGEVGRHVSKDAAVAAAAERMRYLENVKGVKFNWQGAGSAGEAQPSVARITSTGEAPQLPNVSAPQAPRDPQLSRRQGLASESSDPIVREMGKYGWTEIPDPESREMKLQFAGPPEIKEKLVQQLAMQYSPMIIDEVKRLASSADPARQKYWQERLFGDVPPDENTKFLPMEGSPIHNVLSNIVDNFDSRFTDGQGNPLSTAAIVRRSLKPKLIQHAEKLRQEDAQLVRPEMQLRGGGQGDIRETSAVSSEATQGTGYEGGADQPVTIENWRKMQEQRLYQLANEKQVPKDVLNYLVNVVKQKVRSPDDMDRFAAGMNKYGWGDYIMNKALMKALFALRDEELKKSNSSFITRDKDIDPSHQYSHMEGDKDHPSYFFRDANGNFIRYTNAPNGNSDASGRMGEPSIHPSEPTADKAPQFFDNQGRKVTRAPYQGAEVQWNPNYHSHDPENLWVGRWVNPITGEHEHTYVDSDMRMIPKMYIHQVNALVDVRLPVLRKYIRTLFSSPMLKDKIVAVALALIDQGRFRAQELTTLTPRDVKDLGAIFKIGNRLIYADAKLRSMLQLMIKNRTPDEPLFAVPFVKKNGEVDEMLIRRIGPHFLQCSFDQIGISLSGIQTYHATQVFSREVQRLLSESQVPWDSAIEYATVAVAQEMGHDLSQEPDMQTALPMIRDLLIDPIVIDVLKRNAKELDLVGQAPIVLPLPPSAIQYVSMDLITRTADETEFSKWLHSYPAHLHAEVENFQRPATPTAEPQQPNPPNSPDLGVTKSELNNDGNETLKQLLERAFAVNLNGDGLMSPISY